MISNDDLEAFGYYGYWGKEVPDNLGDTPQDMVREFMSVTEQPPNSDVYYTLIKEEYSEWLMEVLNNSPKKELKELADLAYVIFGYAECMGWDLMEALRRVHQNNVGRCVQPDGTVKRRGDGKILKNPDYPKVDLKDLIK